MHHERTDFAPILVNVFLSFWKTDPCKGLECIWKYAGFIFDQPSTVSLYSFDMLVESTEALSPSSQRSVDYIKKKTSKIKKYSTGLIPETSSQHKFFLLERRSVRSDELETVQYFLCTIACLMCEIFVFSMTLTSHGINKWKHGWMGRGKKGHFPSSPHNICAFFWT